MTWPQKKRGSEKNLKLIRISSSRRRPFQKVYVPSPGGDRVSSLMLSFNRTSSGGDGKVALCFPQLHSGLSVAMRLNLDQKSERHLLVTWLSGRASERTHSSCLLGCPFCLPERQVVTLQVGHSSASTRQLKPENTDKAERQRSSDTSPGPLAENMHTHLAKPLFIQAFHYVQWEKES